MVIRLTDWNNQMEKKIHYISVIPRRLEKKVAIYCRVSKNDIEQLNSLTYQISALTRMVATVDQCR